MRQLTAICSLLLLVTLVLGACSDNGDRGRDGADTPGATPAAVANGELPQGGEPYPLSPADFVDVIDNPYWPLTPGSTWVYREVDEEGNELRVEVTVTSDKRDIVGIAATIVRDVVTEGDEVIEDTLDWYAQDMDGNIWYLGEDTKEYEDGEVVSTAGSWEHGVDGALAGILVPADPKVGMAYRQEYYAGEAEDEGRVLSLDESVDVPFGSFEGCLQTEDTTPLEPHVLEHKYYCMGVGLVLAVDVAGGGGREELMSFVADQHSRRLHAGFIEASSIGAILGRRKEVEA